MINNIKKILTIAFVFAFILSAFSFAQEEQDSSMMDKNIKIHKMEMMKDHKMNMMSDSTHQKMNDKMNCTDTTNCAKMKGSMNHKKMDEKDMDHKMMDHSDMMDSSDHKMMNHSNMMDSANHKMTKEKDSIVREGMIDLKSIDKNNDGKVFQDTMDYNVISDKAGKCPLCGMKLKEVSLEKAKENLIKHDFKVK